MRYLNCIALSLLIVGMHAAEPMPSVPVLDVPRLAKAPAITAVADDPAWAGAAHLRSLSASWLDTGVADPATQQPTEVWIGWDATALYLRFQCSADDALNAATKHDDRVYEGDCVEIFLDPVGDGMAVAEYQCSPQGVTFDQQILCTAPPRFQPDGRMEWAMFRNLWYMLEWKCEGLRVATKISGDQWIADFAIPAKPMLSRLGLEELSPMTMRANLARYDWRDGSDGKRQLVPAYWSAIMYGCPHFSHGRMGFLRLVP